jgi:uncharacterized hydrophobic protein (TIGR00271 family)
MTVTVRRSSRSVASNLAMARPGRLEADVAADSAPPELQPAMARSAVARQYCPAHTGRTIRHVAYPNVVASPGNPHVLEQRGHAVFRPVTSQSQRKRSRELPPESPPEMTITYQDGEQHCPGLWRAAGESWAARKAVGDGYRHRPFNHQLVQTERMLHFRIWSPAATSEAVIRALSNDPAVSSLAVLRGASVRPAGDVVLADVAREAANDVVDRLHALDVQQEGSVDIDPVRAWMSQRGLDAERAAPGSSADAVVWADVTHQAYKDSEFNWTYVSFMTMATLIAGIAIVLDSQILVIGAMVLGPEFGAVAALGVALVRRRLTLLARAGRTLFVGFAVAIIVTMLAALVGRALGWVTIEDVTGPRPGTAFIYTPDKWSFIVAVIAAAAGVLSLTSARVGGLSGVFISVTTVPAAGNVALGLAFGLGGEIGGSSLQLLLNLSGMAVAGWATLAVQQTVWSRVSARRARLVERLRGSVHRRDE